MERTSECTFVEDSLTRPPSRGSSAFSCASAFAAPSPQSSPLPKKTNKQSVCAYSPALSLNKDALPAWVDPLLNTEFFTPCCKHPNEKKNECTFFCVEDCCPHHLTAMCQHCLPEHPASASCTILQIRRYVYCNVVRSADIQRYVDISGIQNYIVNSTKVVFLESRPRSKTFKPNSTERCRTCGRYLREGCRYCSLSCKVHQDTAVSSPSQEERSSRTWLSCDSEGDECTNVGFQPIAVPSRKRSRMPLMKVNSLSSSNGSISRSFLTQSKRRKQAHPRRSPSC